MIYVCRLNYAVGRGTIPPFVASRYRLIVNCSIELYCVSSATLRDRCSMQIDRVCSRVGARARVCVRVCTFSTTLKTVNYLSFLQLEKLCHLYAR